MRIMVLLVLLALSMLMHTAAETSDVKLEQDLTCEQAYKLIESRGDDESFVIIDLRPEKIYRSAYLENAIFHDVFLKDIDEWLDKLDRDKTYLVYCTIGHRSGIALEKMKTMGFKKIYHMYEGIRECKAQGYKTASLDEEPAAGE